MEAGANLQYSIDKVDYSMKEGEDFWRTTLSKLEATKSLTWLSA